MPIYQYCLLHYRPDLVTGEQLVAGLIFQVGSDEPFLVVPDSSERFARTWVGFDIAKYRSVSSFYVDGLRAKVCVSKDISRDLKNWQRSGGAFSLSPVKQAAHPAPMERLNQLIDDLILKNL